jgi:hypothetical protein
MRVAWGLTRGNENIIIKSPFINDDGTVVRPPW